MPKLIDLTSKVYGHLKVLHKAKGIDPKYPSWECQCECGKIVIKRGVNLKQQPNISCGCARSKYYHSVHGGCGTKEYHSWQSMKSRCLNENDPNYIHYGGRGVTVCDEWRESFDAFRQSMGLAPSPNHSVERDDVNGNYEPSNCRWATQKEQNDNRRDTFRVTYNGVTKSVTKWSVETGISVGAIKHRIKVGWDIGEALTRKSIRS